nr:MAG TPA: tRNA-dihydrouridine synthase A [Caudoviricetes sp.]
MDKNLEKTRENKELVEYKQKRRVCVAPMLDWTDRHYRYLARQITRNTWLYSEMVNSGAIVYGDKDRFLMFNEGEQPVALQLGGLSLYLPSALNFYYQYESADFAININLLMLILFFNAIGRYRNDF